MFICERAADSDILRTLSLTIDHELGSASDHSRSRLLPLINAILVYVNLVE